MEKSFVLVLISKLATCRQKQATRKMILPRTTTRCLMPIVRPKTLLVPRVFYSGLKRSTLCRSPMQQAPQAGLRPSSWIEVSGDPRAGGPTSSDGKSYNFYRKSCSFYRKSCNLYRKSFNFYRKSYIFNGNFSASLNVVSS